MSIVESIEMKKSPKDIIDDLNLEGFIKYFENIKDEKYKIDTLILACTHFPYLKNEIKLLTNLNIIDASDDMILRL
jgi:asp/glu/hydantoin family racemase